MYSLCNNLNLSSFNFTMDRGSNNIFLASMFYHTGSDSSIEDTYPLNIELISNYSGSYPSDISNMLMNARYHGDIYLRFNNMLSPYIYYAPFGNRQSTNRLNVHVRNGSNTKNSIMTNNGYNSFLFKLTWDNDNNQAYNLEKNTYVMWDIV